MRISLNWLKDYLDIKPDIRIDDISESLTLAGLEVEHVERLGERSREISIGTVTDIHQVDEHQSLYELGSDAQSVLAIGPKSSIALGMLAAFVPANDKYQYRLAHYGDLGLSAGHHELIYFGHELGEGIRPKTLFEVKDFDDVVLSLGITPNRADALSHLGVSRELSASLDINSRSFMSSPREMAGPIHEKVAIEIESSDDCPRYACRLLENVHVKESPYWLKLRLIAAGIRPINNVVDVTNYVMLSRGQPMHAFDYDKLHLENGRAKIVVKRALEDEQFIALDGKEMCLSGADVVIFDGETTLALAGVIGGKACALNKDTKTVLLESAYFDAKNVRTTARRHGVVTESSYRFERGTDPNGVVDALNYAARLLTEITDAKVCREAIDAYRKRIDPQEIKMRPDRAQAVLGMDGKDFDQDLLRKKFLRLGIETVAKRGDAIYFLVPTYRGDLTREIDLIEEAARMIGYDKVKTVAVGAALSQHDFGHANFNLVTRKLKERLMARGFFEAINYAFLNRQVQGHFLRPKDVDAIIEIKNPLSEKYGVMRLGLIPGLVKNLVHNQRNQEKSVLLFETGTVFLGRKESSTGPDPSSLAKTLNQDSYSVEKPILAGIAFGAVPYFAFDQQTKTVDFYHVKGIITEILQSIGLHEQYPIENIRFEQGSDAVYLHPGECVSIRYSLGVKSEELLGSFGKLHPQIADALEVVGDAFVFELDLEKIAEVIITIPKFKPFSRYPTIERDVAFLADEEVRVSDILRAVQSVPNAKATLISLRVFDIFRGKNIGTGKKSVAISLALQKDQRTLTDEEADDFVKQATDLVNEETGATIR